MYGGFPKEGSLNTLPHLHMIACNSNWRVIEGPSSKFHRDGRWPHTLFWVFFPSNENRLSN